MLTAKANTFRGLVVPVGGLALFKRTSAYTAGKEAKI